MEALICLSVFIVVTTIWAIHKTKNRKKQEREEKAGCFLFFFP